MENPVTRERATSVELPWQNSEARAVGVMTALVGARRWRASPSGAA
jgi:hypothetical protein